ncbi:unnamed protein product, partial [Staurois parvus]
VSCDWSQLVTWYKAVVNSLVPCDLSDHSQILHIVSNDVTSDILLTTLHVITDWPIRLFFSSVGETPTTGPHSSLSTYSSGAPQVLKRLAIH